MMGKITINADQSFDEPKGRLKVVTFTQYGLFRNDRYKKYQNHGSRLVTVCLFLSRRAHVFFRTPMLI